MLFSRTLLIAALAATSASAQTQTQVEKRYTGGYSECMDESGGVTVEMMNCIAAEIDVQDARLNQAYVMVMRLLPKPRKDTLRALQRTWIKQRDAKIHFRHQLRQRQSAMSAADDEKFVFTAEFFTVEKVVFTFLPKCKIKFIQLPF